MSVEPDRLISARPESGEGRFDRALRPSRLVDYVGQSAVKEQMEIFIQAARQRGEALDHTLIFGPPGLGKTTIAHIISHELNVSIRTTSGPVLERPGDLAAILSRPGPTQIEHVDMDRSVTLSVQTEPTAALSSATRGRTSRSTRSSSFSRLIGFSMVSVAPPRWSVNVISLRPPNTPRTVPRVPS